METIIRKYRIGLIPLLWAHLQSYAQNSIPYPVILSSRWFHPTSPQDTLSTIRMIDLYKPNRIDWMYCTNNEQLAQLRAREIPYSLALNPQVPDSAGYTVKGRIEDIHGNKLAAPWMRKWGLNNQYWGCANAPEFREVFYGQSRKLIDLGAYGIFMDDSRMNDHATEWGGCFCDYCVKGFTEYLQTNGVDSISSDFNYRTFLLNRNVAQFGQKGQSLPLWKQFRAFQTLSVVRFLKEWKTAMQQYAQRPITFLTNNYLGQWSEIYQVFDTGIAELNEKQVIPQFIEARMSETKRLGKQQYFTLSSEDESKQIQALLLTYSHGSGLIIPWDVYVAAKSLHTPARYFGANRVFQPMYKLFQQEKSTETFTTNTRSARSAASMQVKPASADDSIQLVENKVAGRRIILVNARTTRPAHSIIVQSATETDAQNSIEVVYPTSGVGKKQIKQQTQIRYKGNLLVLSLKE